MPGSDDIFGDEVTYDDSFIGPTPETAGEAYCRETGKTGGGMLHEFWQWRFGKSMESLVKKIKQSFPEKKRMPSDDFLKPSGLDFSRFYNPK